MSEFRNLAVVRSPEELAEVLRANSRAADGCIVWAGALDSKGYGRVYVGTRLDGRAQTRFAHRVAWELANGPVPDGLPLDHLCRNRACINVAHLEPVTHRVNILRGVGITAVNAAKTACISGHEYTPENTRIIRTGARIHRICRACRKKWSRAAGESAAVRAESRRRAIEEMYSSSDL